MSLKRWLPTFLAFPIGGEIAILVVGPLHDAMSAALGGLVVGASVGLAQWLALRTAGVGRRWIARTAVATAAGMVAAVAVTQAGTEAGHLVVTGLIAGGAVGAAQAGLLARDLPGRLLWTGTVAAGWSLSWLTTSFVIVDAARGYHMFGASGAAVVTLLTGLAVRRLLRGAPAGLAPQEATDDVRASSVPAGR